MSRRSVEGDKSPKMHCLPAIVFWPALSLLLFSPRSRAGGLSRPQGTPVSHFFTDAAREDMINVHAPMLFLVKPQTPLTILTGLP